MGGKRVLPPQATRGHPKACDSYNTRGVTQQSGYPSDTPGTPMHLMTSHSLQLNFLLSELLPFSDDLDTEE